MYSKRIAYIIIGFISFAPFSLPGQLFETQVYLIRHAEKDTNSIDDPNLTELGLTRALDLSYLLKDAGIQFIYSTNFRRTQQTVLPLSKEQNLAIEIYDHNNLELLKQLIILRKGVHIVSGHSNSTPALVTLLGGEPGSPIDEKLEFDRLYILNISSDGSCKTTLLRYGPH